MIERNISRPIRIIFLSRVAILLFITQIKDSGNLIFAVQGNELRITGNNTVCND